MNTFLDKAICGNRMFEVDTQELADLLLMLEKVLWHGFKALGFIIVAQKFHLNKLRYKSNVQSTFARDDAVANARLHLKNELECMGRLQMRR